MVGITAYGGYVPRLRLNRQAIHAANKWFAPGQGGNAKGERAIGNWDEDSLTMAVEAARDCLTGSDAEQIDALYFASTTHPFKDRQNAGVIGTALHREDGLSVADFAGSLKAGTTALMAALDAAKAGRRVLVAAADKRHARVASSNEMQFGDGAAALCIGTDKVIAKFLGGYATSIDFVDHFRGDELEFDYGWEERWIRDEGYAKIVPPALKTTLERLKLKGADIAHFIMPSLMAAVPKQMAKAVGIADTAVRDLLNANLGDTGAAHPLVMLALCLENAKAGDKIMVVGFGQGLDVLVFEVTDELAKLPKRTGVGGYLARRKEEKNYMKYLAFNEMLPLEKGMRAEFDKKTALSILYRKRDMIYGLIGGKCKVCGTVQFPKSQVCVNPNCHAMDSQEDYPFAGMEAQIMSWSADSLTFTPDPPAFYGMITFAEGGRFMADFTDCDAEQVKVGARMKMVFRIRDVDHVRGGFKRYFWKATPV
jgi:3-hydroxy-3-methylglutaryl CoA synthase